MNFIEDAILPRSSDSLGKECNTAFKTSQGGSKTTFLPIKLQQSIIQAAMYAASEEMGATKTGGINTTRTKSLTNHSLALVNNSFCFCCQGFGFFS